MRINKKTAAVAVAAVTLAGVGTAYAFWTTTGGGSGTATTSSGAANALTVTQYRQPSPDLLAPSQPGGQVGGKVKNTSSDATGVTYALKAVTMSLSVAHLVNDSLGNTPGSTGYTTTYAATPGCDASDYSLVSDNQTAAYAVDAATGVGTLTTKINSDGSAYELAPGIEGADWAATLAFVNKHDNPATPAIEGNQDACKGQIVRLAYTAVAAS
ncbi:MAG: hypothetical protein JJD92_06230 [Frankiaceae bacterium]|nr:hypothetical protein [Frankiaceae bacterium]